MNYQPRYVAYLALIGGEELATNYYFMSFIGIMKQEYQSYRGVDPEMPILDHKEFTAFIQQWVRHNDEGCVRFVAVDFTLGSDYTACAEVNGAGNVEIAPGPNDENGAGKKCIAQKVIHDFEHGEAPLQDDQPRHYCKSCGKELPLDQSYDYCDSICENRFRNCCNSIDP